MKNKVYIKSGGNARRPAPGVGGSCPVARPAWQGGILFALLTFLVSLAQPASAQWLTQSVTLVPGWNAVYLFVDPSSENLIPGTPGAYIPQAFEVDQVWMWKTPSSSAQYITTPSAPLTGGGQWATWGVTNAQNTLGNLIPNAAYLVHSTATTNCVWNIQGIPTPPAYNWDLSGLNLVGFPTRASNPPSFQSFFAQDPSVYNVLQVYYYTGGEFIPRVANPAQLVNSGQTWSVTPVVRGQAYWVSATNVYNTYFAPFQVTLPSPSGITYGTSVGQVTCHLINVTTNTVTVYASLLPSETPVYGSNNIVAPPPLLLRGTLNASNVTFGYTPFGTNGAPGAASTLSWTLPPYGQSGSDVPVVLGVNRFAMTNSPGSVYAGTIQFSDSLGFSQINVPVTARVGTNAGLWVGNASVYRVGYDLKTYATNANGSFVLNAITNVISATNAFPVGLTTNLQVFNYTSTNVIVSNSVVQTSFTNFYNYPALAVPYQSVALTTNAWFYYTQTISTIATTVVTNYLINSDNTFTWLTSTTITGPVTNLNAYATNYVVVTNVLGGQTVSGNPVSLPVQVVNNYSLAFSSVTNDVFSSPVTNTTFGSAVATNFLPVLVPAYNTAFSNSTSCMIPQGSYMVATNISCTFSNTIVCSNYFAAVPAATLTNSCFAATTGWTLTTGAGSGYYTSTSNGLFALAPAWGSQAAYLKANATLSQTFNVPALGFYQITFACIGGKLGPFPTITVSENNLGQGAVGIGTFSTVPSWTSNTCVAFLRPGTCTLTFSCVNASTGTAGLDNIQINPLATNLLANPNFAQSDLSSGTYIQRANLNGWTGTNAVATGVDANSGTWYGPPAPFAGQAAYIQGPGTIYQVVTVPASGSYALSLYAIGRSVNGQEGIIMAVDGNKVGYWHATNVSSSAWLPYYSTNFNLTAGSHTVAVSATNSLGGDKTVVLQNVSLFPLSTTNYVNPAPFNLIANSGFTGSGVTNGFSYLNTIPGGWSVIAGGVEDVPGTFYSTPAPLPQPSVFLQGYGSMVSQTVMVPVSGTYGLSLVAEGRGGGYGPNGLSVTVDGNTFGLWSGSNISVVAWQSYYSANFTVSAGYHVISVVGYNDLGGDKSTSIQNVQLFQANGTNSAVPILVAASPVLLTNNLPQPVPGDWVQTITNTVIGQTNSVVAVYSNYGTNNPALSGAFGLISTSASNSPLGTNSTAVAVPPYEILYSATNFGLFFAGQTNAVNNTTSVAVTSASFTNSFPTTSPIAVYTNNPNYTCINMLTNVNAQTLAQGSWYQTNFVSVLNAYLLTAQTNVAYSTNFNRTLGIAVTTTNVTISVSNVLQQIVASTNVAPAFPGLTTVTGSTNQSLSLLITIRPALVISNYPVVMAVSNYVIASVATNLDAVTSPATLRLIIFSGTNGTSSLLQQVFYGMNKGGNIVVATTQNALDPAQWSTARRISAVHLPWTPNNTTYPFSGGTLAQGAVLTTTVDEPYDDQAANPFLHTFHPDHNNLDLTQNPPREQAAGVHSYEITRTIQLQVEPSGTDFISLTTAGTSLAGVYNETLTITGLGGATKQYYTQGIFSLTQISPIPTLTTQ